MRDAGVHLTAKELSGSLQAGKISASEIVEHAIARIKSLDGPLSSVCVRDLVRSPDFAARSIANCSTAAVGKVTRR